MVAALIHEQTKSNAGPAKLIAACVGCCVDCLKRIVDTINKYAYMDVAMNSSNYCYAAHAAIGVIAGAPGAIGILTGAMWIITFAGVGLIPGGTGWAVFTYVGQQGTTYANPVAITIASMVVAGLVSLIVMNVLDMVVDTVLFCYASDKSEVFERADSHIPNRFLGCCGLHAATRGVNTLYHSQVSAKAMDAVGLQDHHAPAQYVPKELRPLLHKR